MNVTARFWIPCLLGITATCSFHKYAQALENAYHDEHGVLSRLLQDQEKGYFRTDLEGRMQEAAKTLELEEIHHVNEGDNEFNMKMRGAIRKRGCKTKKSSKSKSKSHKSSEGVGKGKGGKGKSKSKSKSRCSESSAPSASPSSSASPSLRPSSSMTPTKVPSESPSYSKSPSKAPSPVPTVYPSSTPSELGFVLSDCASYSFLWLRDLSQSCRESEEYPSTYIDCACKDAQERINTGEIKKCGKHHQCPYDCAVCELCLSTMVDCP